MISRLKQAACNHNFVREKEANQNYNCEPVKYLFIKGLFFFSSVFVADLFCVSKKKFELKVRVPFAMFKIVARRLDSATNSIVYPCHEMLLKTKITAIN